MPRHSAAIGRDIVEDYVCSRCFGQLVAVKAEAGAVDVICGNSRRGLCNGSGYVTRRYAERVRQTSKHEYWEVLENYPELRPRLHLTDAEILEQLYA